MYPGNTHFFLHTSTLIFSANFYKFNPLKSGTLRDKTKDDDLMKTLNYDK